MEYKVALAQMNSKVGDVEANLEKMANLIGRARDEEAKLTVFPEMSLSGYMVMDGKDFKTFYECAETIDGPSVEAMRNQARENDMYIIFGMPLESSEVKGIFYNSSILVEPSGNVHVYNKVHLPTGNYLNATLFEGLYCQNGSSFPLCETEIGNIGMQICHDFIFPEVSRIYTLKGADILVNISAGPVETKIGFDTILPARAQENAIFFIYVNVPGEQRGARFFGHSRIIHPMGMPIVECEVEKEDFKVASINLDEVRNMRTLSPHLKDRRRSEVYDEILEEFGRF